MTKEQNEVKVSVRFDYFNVVSAKETNKNINITPLLNQFKQFSADQRSMGYVQGHTIRVLDVQQYNRYTYQYIERDSVKTVPFPFWYVVFTRTRPDLPGILKGNATELVPLELPEDEYISENTVFIYDSQKSIAVIQRNLTGTPPKAIQAMFNLHIINDTDLILLAPLFDSKALSRANSQLYHRAITFRVPQIADTISHISDDSPLKNIMESSLSFAENISSPLEIELTIKIPGRKKDYSMKDATVRSAVDELYRLKEQSLVDKLLVKGATDEADQIEEIDLMGDVIRGNVTCKTDKDRYVKPEIIMEKMVHDYALRRASL